MSEKNKKSVLLAEEISNYAKDILDATKENQPPTVFIQTIIIALRKLDHLNENKLSCIDEILFSKEFNK